MDENIFETAAKQGKSSKEKAKQQGDTVKKKEVDLGDTEISGMLKKMKSMREDLENQLSSVYQKGKESKINVDLLIDDASALNAEQFEKMKEQERQLAEKINAVIPPESCLKKNPKNKEKLTQERKGKLRGSRNNWIPVR